MLSSSSHLKPERNRRSMNRQSAILSMPKDLFKPTQLFQTSPISKFQIFEVESMDSGEEFLMKSIKNERCASIQLKHTLDKLQTLEHPGFPRMQYVSFKKNYSYIVFEKPKGKPLWKHGKVVKYPERTVRSIAYQLARCMQYAHSIGIIHRDLRPANIIVNFPNKNLNYPRAILCDFQISKALHPDEKLAILEDGSAFLSAHVRRELGQYPAPEVLMDLKYDRSVDSWFLGMYLYLLISGTVPFPGETDEQVKDAILYHHIEFADDAWLSVSASLDEIITGLLQKDPKKRWPVDKILWSKWIRKFNYSNMSQLILTNWLRKAKVDLNYESMSLCTSYSTFGLHVLDSAFDEEVLRIQDEQSKFLRMRGKARSKKKRMQRKPYSFSDPTMGYIPLVHFSNKNNTVMHQAKIWTYKKKENTVNAGAYVTCASNVWIGTDSDPYTFEYRFDYVKNDIFIGIITDDYEPPKDRTEASRHHLGLNEYSIGISLRQCAAYYNGKLITYLSRSASFNKRLSSFNYIKNFHGNGFATKHESQESDDDVFKFEFEPQNVEKKTPQNFYNIQRSSTAATAGSNPTQKLAGPSPYRKLVVKMRIDCVSRTISLMVNDEVLDPLYFEFPGRITSAITLCHCLDQVTLENVCMDLTY